MSIVRNLVAGLLAALVLGGCAVYGGHPGKHPRHGYPPHSVHIPKGHMPPPGACRIWYPDRPPGQQPPPGRCHRLERRVPPGAVLVYG